MRPRAWLGLLLTQYTSLRTTRAYRITLYSLNSLEFYRKGNKQQAKNVDKWICRKAFCRIMDKRFTGIAYRLLELKT